MVWVILNFDLFKIRGYPNSMILGRSLGLGQLILPFSVDDIHTLRPSSF